MKVEALMSPSMRLVAALGLSVAALLSACRAADPSPIPVERRVIPLTPADTQATKEFEARLQAYLELHRKLEASLPPLSKDSTPEEVDKNQRAFGALVKEQRAEAKRGDFFSPGIQDLVKRTMQEVLGGPDGGTIKASIMDENPGVPNLSVNDRYPDTVPLSTMPPQVLEPLPKLEEDLEYRFIGERLVLVDSHAHIILDFTEDVLP